MAKIIDGSIEWFKILQEHRAKIRTHRSHIQWMHSGHWAMAMHTHSYIYSRVLCAHTTATLLLKNRFKQARTHTHTTHRMY